MLLDFLESVGNAVNNGIQSIGSGARDFHVDNNSYYTNSVLSDIEYNTWRTANAMEEINRRGKRQKAPRERNSRRAYVRREGERSLVRTAKGLMRSDKHITIIMTMTVCLHVPTMMIGTRRT